MTDAGTPGTDTATLAPRSTYVAPDLTEPKRDVARYVAWAAAALVALAVVAAIVAVFASDPKTAIADVAAVIGIVTFGSVAIERSIEAIWTTVGAMKNSWWPFNAIAQEVTRIEHEANATTKDAFTRIDELLSDAKELSEDVSDADVTKAREWLSQRRGMLDKQREELRKLAPGNQRVEMLGNVAFQALSELEARVTHLAPKAEKFVAAAQQSTVAASDFVASFKDNPARRAVSLFLGSTAGMAFAGVVGADIFAAINGTDPAAPFFGVVATGLVMGLGSAPTHEVIKVLQEAKKKRQAENGALPDPGAVGTFISLMPALTTTTTEVKEGVGDTDGDSPSRLERLARAVRVERLEDDDKGDRVDDSVRSRQVTEERTVRIEYSAAGTAPRGIRTYSIRRR